MWVAFWKIWILQRQKRNPSLHWERRTVARLRRSPHPPRPFVFQSLWFSLQLIHLRTWAPTSYWSLISLESPISPETFTAPLIILMANFKRSYFDRHTVAVQSLTKRSCLILALCSTTKTFLKIPWTWLYDEFEPINIKGHYSEESQS